jgi:fatty-acyl-CoA synthase
VPTLRHFVVVEDGTDGSAPDAAVPYEDALAAASPDRDFAGAPGDDHYIAYTGGTTGLPKGVIWRHEDIFFAAMGGGDPTRTEGAITAPEQLAERILPAPAVQVMTAPLMHVSGHWGAFSPVLGQHRGHARPRAVRPDRRPR